MKQFYETYSDPEFVSPLATQLNSTSVLQKEFISSILTKISWTNHLEILSQTKSPEEKFFYLLCCIKEKWSKRELRRQLSSGYFERTMLSKQKASTLLNQLPAELFRDPYIFEFLDLPEEHTENDLNATKYIGLLRNWLNSDWIKQEVGSEVFELLMHRKYNVILLEILFFI